MAYNKELMDRIHRAHEVASSALRTYAAEMIEDGGRKRPRFSPQTTEGMTSLLALMFRVEDVWGENTVAGKAAELTMDYFIAAAEAFGLREHFVHEYPWYTIGMDASWVLELKKRFDQVATA